MKPFCKFLFLTVLCFGTSIQAAEVVDTLLTQKVNLYIKAFEPYPPFTWGLGIDNIGEPCIKVWDSKVVPKPDLSTDLPDDSVVALTSDKRKLVVKNNKKTWAEKSEAEFAQSVIQEEITRQAGKPSEQKILENKYVEVLKQLGLKSPGVGKVEAHLKKAVGKGAGASPSTAYDSDGTNLAAVTAKLKDLAATDATTAVITALELIVLDKQLTKFNPDWDADVCEHVIEETN